MIKFYEELQKAKDKKFKLILEKNEEDQSKVEEQRQEEQKFLDELKNTQETDDKSEKVAILVRLSNSPSLSDAEIKILSDYVLNNNISVELMNHINVLKAKSEDLSKSLDLILKQSRADALFNRLNEKLKNSNSTKPTKGISY